MTKKPKNLKIFGYAALLAVSNIAVILWLILFVPSLLDIVLIPVLLFFSIFSWRILFANNNMPLVALITHALIVLGLVIGTAAALNGQALYHATLSPFVSIVLLGLTIASIAVFIRAKRVTSSNSKKSK